LNDDGRLVGIQPHQSLLVAANIIFARCLVMSIVLQPWAHSIVPPSAQNKQSVANFKHLASLLLHVYNLALSSLTRIPVSLLRPVAAGDGLLQATDEGFQVMLRYCDADWLQQLKTDIEAWLVFVMQNVNPRAVDVPELQQLDVSDQAAAAEIMAVPEVRALGLAATRVFFFCCMCARAYLIPVVLLRCCLHACSLKCRRAAPR
jgi:hypothetical protein